MIPRKKIKQKVSQSEFFVDAAAQLFEELLRDGTTLEQLAELVRNEEDIDRRVEGTRLAILLDKRTPQQRSAVLALLHWTAQFAAKQRKEK